jgi:beta-galactosidase
MGGKGIIYWCYDTEATGMESTGFGLVDRDGSPTERVLEAAEDHRLIQSNWDIIKDYKPKPEVAILVDLDNALLTFAMSGQEDASVDSFRGYYKALWNCDLAVDFIEAKNLNNNGYRVIIVPWHLIGKKETCEQLRLFVEAGGTLLIETGFGTYDEHMVFNSAVPPFGLTDVFGYREGEVLYMEGTGQPLAKMEDLPASERIYVDGHLDFSEPVAVRVKAHTFLTPLIIGSATVIAKYESTPVAAMKKVGRGQVFYFGTNLGASIEAGGQGGMDLVRAIVTHVVRPLVTADKVRPRLLEAPNASLLMVFNDGIEDQTASIKLPSKYVRATDLYSDETHTVEQQSIEIKVPFEGVTVLRLT